MTELELDALVQRLHDGALASLFDLVLDDLWSKPVTELLEPAFLAARISTALRESADDPKLEAWLGEQFARWRDATIEPGPDGRAFPPGETLRRWITPEISEPAEALLSEPYLPDRDLVLRLMDHEAMHSLIQEVLHASISRFARKMRSFKPDTSRLKAGLRRAAPVPSGLSRLRSIGSAAVSAVGSELESQLDQRVGDFVSQAISAVMSHIATLLTAPERAETMGDWRAYGLRVVLDTELEVYAAEARKLDPDRAVSATLTALRALAKRPTLERELEDHLQLALAPLGELSLGAWLRDAGLEETAREAAHTWLVQHSKPVLGTTEFRAWLQGWLGMGESP